MPWFVSALVICLLFFAAAFVASETLIGRINRSKAHRRGLDSNDRRQQQLYDVIVQREDRQRSRESI